MLIFVFSSVAADGPAPLDTNTVTITFSYTTGREYRRE